MLRVQNLHAYSHTQFKIFILTPVHSRRFFHIYTAKTGNTVSDARTHTNPPRPSTRNTQTCIKSIIRRSMTAALDKLLFTEPLAGSFHRTPSSARFHFPSPRGSPHASNRFAPHQSALPEFFSAVPRTQTPAGNLRLLHPVGYILPRDGTGGQSSRLTATIQSSTWVGGRFQAPWAQGQGRQAEQIKVPRPKDTPLRSSPRATGKATPSPGSFNDLPRAHYFGLWGARPDAEQFKGVETTRWQNDAIAARRAARTTRRTRWQTEAA